LSLQHFHALIIGADVVSVVRLEAVAVEPGELS